MITKAAPSETIKIKQKKSISKEVHKSAFFFYRINLKFVKKFAKR